MGHQPEPSRLSAAPASDDIDLVKVYFSEKCNCYSYAVQDYLAGYLGEHNNDDFNYLPRPGQTRGRTYEDLWLSPEGMRRAVHEDGIDFAGMKYPKRIPPGHYVICCFLEPKEYHFIRQNRDGSWSSKDGLADPTNCDCDGKPLTNPEDYYHGDKRYQFVGYFFVPEGGVRVGVRGYEKRRLAELERRTKNPAEERERRILRELVSFADDGEQTVKAMQELSAKHGMNTALGIREIWEKYRYRSMGVSPFCKAEGYTRKSVLRKAFTRPKNAREVSER